MVLEILGPYVCYVVQLNNRKIFLYGENHDGILIEEPDPIRIDQLILASKASSFIDILIELPLVGRNNSTKAAYLNLISDTLSDNSKFRIHKVDIRDAYPSFLDYFSTHLYLPTLKGEISEYESFERLLNYRSLFERIFDISESTDDLFIFAELIVDFFFVISRTENMEHYLRSSTLQDEIVNHIKKSIVKKIIDNRGILYKLKFGSKIIIEFMNKQIKIDQKLTYRDWHLIFLTISGSFQDVYTLSKLFSQNTGDNVIMYFGKNHIDNYISFLEHLGADILYIDNDNDRDIRICRSPEIIF